MTTHMLQQLEPDTKIPLSVPLIASYFQRGYKRGQMAAFFNTSKSAVYDYCKKHYEELAPFLDNTDTYKANVAQHVSNQAKKVLLNVIDTTTDWDKRDLIPLTAVSDRHQTQAQMLSGKATQVVTYETLGTNVKELEANNTALEQELQEARDR